MKIFRKTPIDQNAAAQRLACGRLDAQRIIQAMSEKRVTVELFGSMKTGAAHQFSDIDLLVTDCGALDPAFCIYEIELLSGEIPVDVIIQEYLPQPSNLNRP